METEIRDLPLVVIVGPTASGKTSLAIEIATKFNGEIICADSRSIYKYMDIGTAKPTLFERNQAVHWGLDLIGPGEYFSAADFKDYAMKKIKEIRGRGKLPVLVGGSGLYVDAVIFDYKFGPKANESLRQELQHKTLDELKKICEDRLISLPENNKNKRYVMRAIETDGYNVQKNNEPLDNTIIVGITTKKEDLLERISKRVDQMFENGVVDEAKWLFDHYNMGIEAMKSNIYPLIKRYIQQELSAGDVKNTIITLDWRLAKKQLTWLRRNKYIEWFELDSARKYLLDNLANIE